MTVLFVPEEREGTNAVPVDWPGLLLLSFGLLCLLFGFTRAGDEGWTNIVVVGSCLSGIVILALFVLTERRARWPLIDLAVFRNLPFVMGCLSFFFFSAALFGSQHYWSLFIQNTWGFSFLMRGIAIPIFTSCVTLAVVSAVPAKQSGLASGTLGMARNIGTAFGVAILSQVYLFHVNTAIPASLAASRLAAGQFLASGNGLTRLVIEEVIL
jgi:hypothetical protein